MYHQIEIGSKISIASIIGRLYVANIKADFFSRSFICCIFNELRNTNEFISFDTSYRSIKELLGDDCLRDECIWIPLDEETRKSLKRAYYSLDTESRNILSSVLSKYIKDIKKNRIQLSKE